MAITFKKSISDPPAVDKGNQTIQEMVVSKTIQFGLFTTNENAVWAAKQQLQKESYPFAYITIPVNRNMFRLKVGGVFKFSYAQYGITDMVCRVLQIEEENLESEKITIHAMEDIFSITNAITAYTDPEDNTITAPDYELTPFAIQQVRESIYVLSQSTAVIPMASIDDPLLLGYDIYMSIDGGSSYSAVGRSTTINPYGTLNAEYPLTYTIDETVGFVVDFVNGQDLLETVTLPDILSGNKNNALLGDEYISFQTVTPITETQYRFDGIIRGRWGSEKVLHASGQPFTVMSNPVILTAAEIAPGADRKFKFVPFNSKFSGSIALATAMDLSITGVAKTPYIPVNFIANDGAYDARYDDDVVLEWDGRKRGTGAGIGIPGTVLSESAHEGLFKVEVWVSSVLKRTTTDLDVLTWTYTEAMNLSDNTSLASSITFKLSNFIVDLGITYESDQVEVVCTLN